MRYWSEAFWLHWSWRMPANVLGMATLAVIALIPLTVGLLARASQREVERQGRQAARLRTQGLTARRQRRDSPMSIVRSADDATHLRLLWDEIQEFDGGDKKLLLAQFRTNPSIPLPSLFGEYPLGGRLNREIVADYVAGLENRYRRSKAEYASYDGLRDFIRAADDAGAAIAPTVIADLLTGPSTENQRPSHMFYRELVGEFPEIASALLYSVSAFRCQATGGIRRNVLTGVLLAAIESQDDRSRPLNSHGAARETFRSRLPSALATLLHGGTLHSLGLGSRDGATEPVSATVAWLIQVVGWLADEDDHMAMRMIENLAPVISSVPDDARGWGIDDQRVQQGFRWMKEKQPFLWNLHGPAIEAAATAVGQWWPDGEPVIAAYPPDRS